MPESSEDFYARIAEATDDEGRLPFHSSVEEWETFPLEAIDWRVRPVGPLEDRPRERYGEDPAQCWCAQENSGTTHTRVVWRDENWVLVVRSDSRLPITLLLQPRRHGDLTDLDPARAAELGPLLVALARAVEALPSVGRAHISRWGDGGAHLHWWVMGRPARIPQLLGSFLPLWEEFLPPVPPDVQDENVRFVLDRLVDDCGGEVVHAAAGSASGGG
jgi:diadenosine tetraphosphate (Ap4A) HIT family hydrolase